MNEFCVRLVAQVGTEIGRVQKGFTVSTDSEWDLPIWSRVTKLYRWHGGVATSQTLRPVNRICEQISDYRRTVMELTDDE